MKLAILAGAAFVASLGGSTAFVALRAPAHATSGATTHADSTAAPAAPAQAPPHGASTTPAGAAPRPAAASPAGARATAPAGAGGPAIAPAPASGVSATSAASATFAADAAPDYKGLSRILSNMKPAQAGAVIARLDDADVEGILRSLGPRPSATLLAMLPPDRAAALSRRLLVPVPGAEAK